MELIFFCKILTDLALYFAFGTYIFAWMGHRPPVMGPFLIMLVTAMICYALRRKQPEILRLLPLSLMLFCFLFPENILDSLLLAPACLYVGFVAKRQLFRLEYNTQHDAFLFGVKLLPLLLAPSLLTLDFEQLEQGALPFVVLYLVCGVLLMRMLRHDEATIQQTRFKLQNAAAVIVCCILGYELSRGTALRAGARLLSLFYHKVISPLLMLVAYALSFFIYLFTLFLKLFFKDIEVTRPESSYTETIPSTPDVSGTNPVQFPPWLVLLGKILLVAVILLLVFLLLRRLLRRGKPIQERIGSSETREGMNPVRKEPRLSKDLFAPQDPRQAIRFYYRKFLRLYLSMGLPFNRSKTSAQIQEDAAPYFEKDLLTAFRKLYIKARYSTSESTPEEAAQAKKLYHALKAQKSAAASKKAQKKPRPPKTTDQYR